MSSWTPTCPTPRSAGRSSQLRRAPPCAHATLRTRGYSSGRRRAAVKLRSRRRARWRLLLARGAWSGSRTRSTARRPALPRRRAMPPGKPSWTPPASAAPRPGPGPCSAGTATRRAPPPPSPCWRRRSLSSAPPCSQTRCCQRCTSTATCPARWHAPLTAVQAGTTSGPRCCCRTPPPRCLGGRTPAAPPLLLPRSPLSPPLSSPC
mmetsp:Transcript_13891/g.33518  ORF Transcript_13891/g.33518 Transcript_13891/m.33518 type:complete len:206 (-) Transcript_13891:2332-2949(-)